MALLNVEAIPHPYPRRFVPPEAHLGDWETVEKIFGDLLGRSLSSPRDLEKWLGDLGEFQDCLGQEGSLRYVRMTCKTDDPQIEKSYLDFLEKVSEPSKPKFFALSKKYWDCPYRPSLPAEDYFLYNRSIENDLALYREENIPLETELEKLSQEYQKLSGSLMVNYEGKEQTLQQMGRYMESTDRVQREEAWKLVAERRLKEKDHLDELFDKMLKLRVRAAGNAGFSNYRDYIFRRKERFDYGPRDCEAFHESAEKAIRPLVLNIQQKRKKKMGLSTLRPWDLSVDPSGLPPLKPFENNEKLIDGCEKILSKIDSGFGGNFRQMRELGLLDLESRKGKAPGGYQADLEEARIPFIFANAVGLDHDVRTLLHESGHAMHSFAWRNIPFSPYRHAPMEFCEVASMSMELMADPFLNEFYPDPREAARSTLRHLEDVIILLPWIANVDAFQHWIYTHPQHTRGERADQWLNLRRRLGGMEDWSGFEEVQAALWHRQLHIFEYPFYYIEYGIAQLGALQVWKNFRKDKAEAVRLYKQGLSVGGSKTLPEIFKSAGIRFDFSLEMIEPLMEEVAKELERLEAYLDPI
ncbi:MAG TPA: M3 family oligoendopeptidase [bacterium]|jgi:oligoendopeptidase F|nr:M3 family oligoendopeptidase [bacterium]